MPSAAQGTNPSKQKKPPVACPERLTFLWPRSQPHDGPYTYVRGRLLGSGGFASVYEMSPTSGGSPLAVKVVAKSSLVKPKSARKMESEIAIHATLRHRYIVRFFHHVEDDNNLYLLLEPCSGRTLADLVQGGARLDEPEVARLLRQVLSALRYLHLEQRVVHRDLKLSNIFLTSCGNVKIGDFGLAARLASDNERRSTICGTPNYIAPEVLRGKKDVEGHSFPVDLWSLGVMAYTLLVGKPPFEACDVKATYRRIRSGQWSLPASVQVSPSATSLLHSLLQQQPTARPTVAELHRHAFFWPGNADGRERQQHQQDSTAAAEADGSAAPRPAGASDGMAARGDSAWGRLQGVPSVTAAQKRGESPGRAAAWAAPSASRRGIRSASARPRQDSADEEAAGNSGEKVLKAFMASEDAFGTEAKVWMAAADDLQRQQEAVLRTWEQLGTAAGAAAPAPAPAAQEAGGAGAAEGGGYRPGSRIGTAAWMAAGGGDVHRLGLLVAKWCDYSSKYGLGYLLQDGFCGVLFNDQSHLLIDSQRRWLLCRPSAAQAGGDGGFVLRADCAPPPRWSKKVLLAWHFESFLTTGRRFKGQQPKWSHAPVPDPEPPQVRSLQLHVTMARWARSDRAILFRLSDATTQVNFNDASEVVMLASGEVSFMDRGLRHWRSMGPDARAGVAGNSLKKRLQYIDQMAERVVPLTDGR